jgi:hypothetical protein
MLVGRGVLLVDSHGDLARLNFRDVPKMRWNDVSFFEPTLPTCRCVNQSAFAAGEDPGRA